MQELPGAPGTARQGRTRIIVSTNDGGVATQPRAPGHDRPRTASFDAARHGRPRATPTAPGVDVPPATTAGASGQHRLRAVPPAPDHARSDARHQRAPGHGRPLAASSDAVRHDRPRATPTAPGVDVPPATTAGAPGQHRLSAVANATVALPAGQRRLRQVILPRVPANPRTLTYPHSQLDTAHNRESGNPRPPVATGGPPGGYAPATRAAYAHTSLYRSPCSTHQVHPAIQVPSHPRSCSAACTGFPRHHSRAPPTPTHRLVVAACAAIHVPPRCGGTIGGPLCALCMLCG